MNKIVIGMLLTLAFLMALVVAPLSTDRERSLTVKETELAEARGIDNYTYQDFSDDDTFHRCLQSGSDFRLPCSPKFDSFTIECTLWNETISLSTGEVISQTHSEEILLFPNTYDDNETFKIEMECLNEERFDFTDEEIETKLNNWEDVFMKNLFVVEETRENELNKTLVREGTVTVRER